MKTVLIVLDLGLPLVDGLDVARAVRKASNVPIVMLTGRGDEADRITVLELGADDYVTKPFSPKVHAAGEVTLDVPRVAVRVRGSDDEQLTPTEFQLLVKLARAPGRIYTRAQLL